MIIKNSHNYTFYQLSEHNNSCDVTQLRFGPYNQQDSHMHQDYI